MSEVPADPHGAARLLRGERDRLLPLLRAQPESVLGTPTCLPEWSVRDVLAHCAAVLGDVGAGRERGYGPVDNQIDVDERRDWPVPKLLDELADGYEGAAAAVTAAAGRLDGVAIGEWVHGGDVREALGLPHPYGGEALADALALLAARSRARISATVSVVVTDLGSTVRLGDPDGPETVRLVCEGATLVRLLAGRPTNRAAVEVDGADLASLVLFG